MATTQVVHGATVTPRRKSSRVKVVKKHEGMEREKPLKPRLPCWLSYLIRKARVLKNCYVGHGSPSSHPKHLGADQMVYIEPHFSLPVLAADTVN